MNILKYLNLQFGYDVLHHILSYYLVRVHIVITLDLYMYMLYCLILGKVGESMVQWLRQIPPRQVT